MAAPKKPSRVRGLLAGLAVALLLAAFIGTLVFLYVKSQDEEITYKTESPKIADIVRKAVATGSIVPRHEIFIKPRVSGVVHAVYVEPGAQVKKGTLIAEIKIVPDMAALTRAEAQVRSAGIALKHAQSELKRAERLQDRGLLAERELAQRKLDRDLRKSDLGAAVNQLQVVKEGAARKTDETTNTKIRSTVDGTVLEVPVEVGGSVIESNNFNAGTTIATVANMGDMIFLGKIDEADVDKIRSGMDVNIKIGAIDDKEFGASLEYIAPKGAITDGAVQFEIKAALKPTKGTLIRAGYSANAEILLERRNKVLSVRESLLQFEGEKPYVEVEIGPNEFERRDLEVGISDGINIEIKGGVDESAKIKQPTPPEKPDK
jgi:HlyD family secretion protein